MGRLFPCVALAVAVIATAGPATADQTSAARAPQARTSAMLPTSPMSGMSPMSAPPGTLEASRAPGAPVPPRRMALAANFFKPLLGLVQVESEVYLTGRVAVRVSAEHLFVRQADFDHPDLFAFVGPRLYLWSHVAGDRQSGLVLGPFAGLSCTFDDEQPCGAVAGAELGYLVPLGKHAFVLGRGLAHVSPGDPAATLGGEILAGFRFAALQGSAR